MRLLGSDPEVFLSAASGPVIATGYVPGTKRRPKKVRFGAVQQDNVAAEFNIEPAATEEDWVRNHVTVLNQLSRMVGRKGLTLDIRNAVAFDKKQLQADRLAMVFGCDPSFDAWRHGVVIEPPNPNTSIRTCGGHVHIGDDRLLDIDTAMHAVRLLSVFVLPKIRSKEPDEQRSASYGKAGAFRMKPYGVEWRGPANTWLRSEASMRWMYRAVNAVLDSDYINDTTCLNRAWHSHEQVASSYDGSMRTYIPDPTSNLGEMP